MYMSEKPQQQEPAIDFYTAAASSGLNKPESVNQNCSNMIIHLTPQPHLQHLPDGAAASIPSVGDDAATTQNSSNPSSSSGPKKRAETWVQEETRVLISLRKEIDSMFNQSKSNKHLWDNISLKMREKGFDRSPTMCTDKWRNLLKEFKKVKQSNSDGNNNNNNNNNNGYAKMSYYKDIDELLSDRSKTGPDWKCSEISNNGGGAEGPKVDSFMQFSDKGIDDASLPFGPVEANGRSTLNLERRLDHDGLPLAITATDAVAVSGGVSPWNWRETPGSGEQTNTYGRVITVKLGDYTKRIGIDGSANAIKEAIKSAFRLRTKRAFWLEDEENVVRSLDRDMPLGNYTLHVDEGLTIKVCIYEETDPMPVRTVDKTFYSDDDFRDFLSRRGWASLREYNGFRNIDSMDELCPGAIYRGVN